MTASAAGSHATKPTIVEVTLTRQLKAPRALVWKAWTDPAMLARWWGPHGFTNPRCEIDPRVGGKIYIHMQAPDGFVHPMSGSIREVEHERRLVFLAVAEDHDGKPLLESLTTVTFEDSDGGTKLAVHARGTSIQPIGAEMLGGMNEGWNQSLERLTTLVQG